MTLIWSLPRTSRHGGPVDATPGTGLDGEDMRASVRQRFAERGVAECSPCGCVWSSITQLLNCGRCTPNQFLVKVRWLQLTIYITLDGVFVRFESDLRAAMVMEPIHLNQQGIRHASRATSPILLEAVTSSTIWMRFGVTMDRRSLKMRSCFREVAVIAGLCHDESAYSRIDVVGRLEVVAELKTVCVREIVCHPRGNLIVLRQRRVRSG